MVWLASCGVPRWLVAPPKIALNCSPQPDGSLLFELQAERAHSVDQVVIWSETTGEALWGFEIAHTPVDPAVLKTFTYGLAPQVPDQPSLRTVKLYPPKGKPRPIGPLERFIVKVEFQYDTDWGPAAGHTYFYFDALQGSSAKITGRIGSSKVMPAAFLEAFK